MTERQYHPVANLFPLLSGEEFESLRDDIAEHGLRDPICLHTDGSIVDGRNRYRACLAAGVKPDFYTFDGTDEELLPYVLSLNLHRRHLNPTQLGFVGAEVEEYYAIEARKRQAHGMTAPGVTLVAHGPQASGDDTKEGKARDHAAEAIGTSARGIARAKKLKREAAPEIVSACIDGTLRARDAVGILDLSHDEQRQCLEAVQQGQARTVTRAKEQAQPKAVHVAHNSGNNEWYTPSVFIEAARTCLGEIDLDPASSPIANVTVRAKQIFTAEQDGLKQPWHGRVWLNPPYAQPLIAQFAEAVASKYESGEIEEAIVLVNNATETAWFRRMLRAASAICFPAGRIKFVDPEGKPSGAPLQGQAILYMGERVHDFTEAHKALGSVLHVVTA